MDSLEEYLDVLFDGLEGLVYSPVKTVDKFETNWFEYPAQRQDLVRHIQSGEGDVYISPAVYSERRAVKDSIKAVQCAWVEFDGAEKIDFQTVPKPTAIVQTSFDTNLHCYWRIGPTNKDIVEDINRRLTHYLGADSSGWDSTQLLRPPSTKNCKHNPPKPVILAHSSRDSFPVGTFDAIPKVPAPVGIVFEESELLPVSQILNNHQLPLKVIKMIKKEDPKHPYRSSFLAALALELAEEGLEHTEIVSLLKHADERIQKYHGRQDQLVRLSQLADYAILKHTAEETVPLYTTDFILNHTEDLDWIFHPWLHTTGQMVVAGSPGAGKTQLTMQMAYCLATNHAFLGKMATRRYRVAYYSLEMPKESIKYFLNHQKHEWSEIPEIWWLDEETSYTQYENIIDENDIEVVFVDSLTEILDDTNDDAIKEARRIMKWCRKVRRRYNCAVVLIHHTRKATEGNKRPKNLSDLMGAQHYAKDTETVQILWEERDKLDLIGVKVRFGMKESIPVVRNENIWFRKRNEDASSEQRPTQPNPQRSSEQQDTSPGPGVEYNRSPDGSFNIGFGSGDGIR